MDDVSALLDELQTLVQDARAMPMSASCVVNRGEVLDLLERVRAGLPRELDRASAVLGDKEAVVAQGREEAERLLEQARQERGRLLEQSSIVREARAQATRLVDEARAQADAMREEVEEYCDKKLANFEIVLSKTLAAVQRGRDKLSGRSELSSLDDDRGPVTPLPG